MEERKLILAIDFNNVLFGSYYGETLINSKGQNVNAVKGFFFKIKMLKELFNPAYIVIASDVNREKTFRKKLYKPYKAQRKPKDDDILFQMKYAYHLARLLGYPFINNELYEADDVLGMIAKWAGENNMDTILVSSDKDLYQLIDEHTYIFSPRGKELLDLGWLEMNYKVTPQQWIDLKILQGDRSDNIPGIDGVGEVTALKLIQEYKSIDKIYMNLNQLKPNLKDKLQAGVSLLPLIRELVTIVTDYNKIEFDPKMLDNTGVYRNELFEMLRELEIPSLYNVMNYSLLV